MVWDRHNIHGKSRAVRAYLAKHPEIVAENFPGYSMPDLNPDESVWSWTKYGRLSNFGGTQNAEELWDHVVEALIDLKFQPQLLQAFIRNAEIPVAA